MLDQITGISRATFDRQHEGIVLKMNKDVVQRKFNWAFNNSDMWDCVVKGEDDTTATFNWVEDEMIVHKGFEIVQHDEGVTIIKADDDFVLFLDVERSSLDNTWIEYVEVIRWFIGLKEDANAIDWERRI